MKSLKIISYAFLLFALTYCGAKKETKEETLRPVRYHTVGKGDGNNLQSFSGVAKVGNDITLSFRSSGVIVEKNATKGESVKKGTLLGKLDNVEAELAYQKAVSDVKRTESDLNTSKTNLDRIKALYEKGGKSLSEYEDARNGYENASSQYETAKRNRSIQKTQLDYGYIYAPKDGVIAESNGSVNERVSAGHKFAVLNVSDGRMKVTINLPESAINKVKLNMNADISFPAIEENFNGEIVEISPVVEEESSTYPVDVEITDPNEDIKVGMAAEVSFNFKEEQKSTSDALTIPIQAVGEDAKGNFVFVVETSDDKTGTVKKQHIEVGELTSDGFEVVKGLSSGQKVATAGLQTLLDGQKVSL
ncbi:MAG: efflux RND transporter periplasmic adaptor subunit [Bacteroidota bacterium]